MTERYSPKIETPGDEEALANFMYSIRSYDEAEAKAKLLWPALRASQAATPTGGETTQERFERYDPFMKLYEQHVENAEIDHLRAALKDAEDRADLYANSRPVVEAATPRKWDEGEHEGCGIDSQRALERQSRLSAASATLAAELVHRFEYESMALHKTQREWLVREIGLALSNAPAQGAAPIAWMNSGHIEAYQSGKKDGIAWASPLESDVYNVALYTAPQPVGAAQGSRNNALSALAGLFSESVHETWTKSEIVNIIEDAIRLGSPISSKNQETGK